MYVSPSSSVTDPEMLFAFIRRNSFATLISADPSRDNLPVGTHLPLLLEADAQGAPVLCGHFARANSHWQIASGQSVLAIFQGPHAYISAGWYGETNVVPTWNYVSVHVEGRLTLETDEARLEQLLRRTVMTFESELTPSWSMDSADPAWIRQLTAAVVGFSISMDRMDGCWKLNQHHSEARRAGAIQGLTNRGRPHDLEIARLMRQHAPASGNYTRVVDG